MEVSAMPYVIRPPIRRMRLVGALLAAGGCALLFPLSSARAADGCPDVPVSQPFSLFGDYADYFLVKKGNFESDTRGWRLDDARVVAGNESYYVGGPSDTSSVSIGRAGSVVSTRFCIDVRHPHMRFFARQTDGVDGLLSVQARWTDALKVQKEQTLGVLSGAGFSSWAPSDLVMLAGMVELTDPGGTQSVQLVFTPLSGSWEIDDVYVDPYRR
ncbi:MAG TPA: hypothetical protein VKA89_00730 [Solirubrobacterales bacterium]|nr:hypothetical protein [Solirubrobacterales bacterium]